MSVTLSCGSPPDANVGTTYTHLLPTTGTGPFAYELVEGYLPPGLTLDPVTGAITGMPVDNGGTFLHLDATTADDQGLPIDTIWESGLVRGDEANSSMVRFGAADVWIRGEGPITVTVYGPDKQKILPTPLRSVNGQPVTTLTPTPGIMYALKFDLSRVENATFRFETTAAGAWFEMSGFRAYFRPDLYNR